MLYVSPRQYSHLLKATSNDIRSFQQNAWNRASYGSKHPLFKGEVGMWNGILVKKLNRAIRFGNGSSMQHVIEANKATGNETTTAVPAAITSAFAVDRAILLGAQALGNAYGKNKGQRLPLRLAREPVQLRARDGGRRRLHGRQSQAALQPRRHPRQDHGVMVFDFRWFR